MNSSSNSYLKDQLEASLPRSRLQTSNWNIETMVISKFKKGYYKEENASNC